MPCHYTCLQSHRSSLVQPAQCEWARKMSEPVVLLTVPLSPPQITSGHPQHPPHPCTMSLPHGCAELCSIPVRNNSLLMISGRPYFCPGWEHVLLALTITQSFSHSLKRHFTELPFTKIPSLKICSQCCLCPAAPLHQLSRLPCPISVHQCNTLPGALSASPSVLPRHFLH